MKLRLATALLTSGLVVAGTGAALASVPAEPPVPAPVGGDLAPGRVLVHYKAGVNAAALEHTNGASRLSRIADLGVDVLKVPAGAEQRVVDALRRSGKVDFAERDGVVHATDVTPNDTWWSKQWSPAHVNAPAAWSTTTGDATQVVAVLDTGAAAVPDLAGKLTSGYDFVNGDSDPSDDNGHGTLTAGVVGAVSNNATGVAGFCWGCIVMPIKVLAADGSGTYSNLISGITWAADHGATVVSMSLSGTVTSSSLASAVQYAHDKGLVLVAAAGNSSCNCPVYPAAYGSVMGVAATDGADALASYSNFGTWVKVAAPGSNYSTTYTGGYTSFAGTSSAAPVVAGIVGLMRSANPSVGNAAIEAALESSSVPVGSIVQYGRVDAAAAVKAAIGGAATTSSPSPSTTTSPSPAPSPAASAAPTPSPTVSPSPAPSSSSTTFTGTFGKAASRFSQTLQAGTAAVSLATGKPASVTLSLVGPDGATIGTWQGASPLSATATLAAAGNYVWAASSGTRTSFSLTVTA